MIEINQEFECEQGAVLVLEICAWEPDSSENARHRSGNARERHF